MGERRSPRQYSQRASANTTTTMADGSQGIHQRRKSINTFKTSPDARDTHPNCKTAVAEKIACTHAPTTRRHLRHEALRLTRKRKVEIAAKVVHACFYNPP